nr:pyruvate dehydrogenase (acetyl-transferring) E1 component subunit alpha [Halogranum amylolyticum]
MDDDLARVLDADGHRIEGREVPPLSDEQLVGMYRDMKLSRHFDERAVSLQRQGRIGTYAPLAGQEGSQVGSTYALDDEDWILYQYREHGAVVVRDALEAYLPYWVGYEEGNAAVADANVFPLNITIADHIPHAVGMAWASKLKDESKAFLCHFGDGATSEGDFHEGLNFAGVFDTPSVFLCHNNQWAISVPAERQTASATFAEKAEAYGFEGVRVDGMDPLATYRVTKEAVERARNDEDDAPRPTLIEAVQYRYGAHTTADDPTAYRDDAEIDEWKRWDPIERLSTFLRETGRLDDERDDAIETEIRDHVADVLATIEELEPNPDDMFEYTYAELPAHLETQRDELRRLREKYGDEAFLRE